MSPRPTSARAVPTLRAVTVVATVALLVLGAVLLGQRLFAEADADAGAPGDGAADPRELTFSTFLGGLEWDEANDVEVDADGNRYVAGFTTSRDFPDAEPIGPGGITDAFVAKISPDNSLVWGVVLGGSDLDTAYGLALDDDGNVYVTGRTGSPDFPVDGALQPELNGEECTGEPCHDAYVTKLDPAGGLVFSTYFGGSLNEEGLGIAVDADGGAVISGNTDSRDLPTVSPFQAEFGSPPCPGDLPCELDAFVSKLSPDGTELTFSTYLGGNAGETNTGVALADDGTVFVTGTTRSTDFPTANAFQESVNGTACGPPPGSPCPDAFVTALAPDGSSAVYSTLLGGTEPETGSGIAVDSDGRAVVTGGTQSPDFPTARPAQEALDNSSCTDDQPEEFCDDGFVTRFTPDGSSLDFSTFLGGLGQDQGLGIAVDASGAVVVAGTTDSRDFPTLDPVQEALGGYIDGFVAAFAADNGALAWSTFLGGSEADRANAVTVGPEGDVETVGRTLSPDFPTVEPVQAELQDDDYDAFLTTLSRVSSSGPAD
jgi:Beta-propeller repeat